MNPKIKILLNALYLVESKKFARYPKPLIPKNAIIHINEFKIMMKDSIVD